LKKTVTAILFRVDENDIAFLKREWDDLLSLYTSDQSIQDNSFQLLKEQYSETSRFYHNLSHIKSLLNLLESLDGKLQDQNAIRFSIWFHDVIYDPKRNDNEEESAIVASEMLSKFQVNTETIEFVRDLILATKSHSGRYLSEDAKLFLDMDLAILGMQEETYQKYSKAIREEYSWVPELQYRRTRRKILESFIDRERIYFTNEMKKRFERQARKNIHKEIKSLGAQ
jgi:predicted metal-dependent HD superfamily phosphohydrolase